MSSSSLQQRDQDNDMPPAKRPKIFRACEVCVRSKTRCEDVSPEGCSLCRRRGRVCSLASAASTLIADTTPSSVPAALHSSHSHSGNKPHPTPGTLPHTPSSMPADWDRAGGAEVEALRYRLAEAERRVARTEAALGDLEARVERESRAKRGHRYERSVDERERARETEREPEVGDELPIVGPLRLASTRLLHLDETTFAPAAMREYPDPVIRGVVSAAHVELAWHSFKARISALLPLPPFTTVSAPVPNHGFVVLAALHHVPSMYTPRLSGLLNECLLLAMSGASSVDVILALLIMSLAPTIADQEEPRESSRIAPQAPTAYRMIALAYSMGESLGLHSMAEAALRRDEELNNEHWSQSLWHLQLWSAVVNRHALLCLMHGQARIPHQTIAERLPVLRREPIEMCNRHLRAEAELVNIFLPMTRALSELEHGDAEFPLPTMSNLLIIWRDVYAASRPFSAGEDNTPFPIRNDARCIEFAIGVRLASLTTWIPSPLMDAREEALKCLSKFPSTMTAMINIIEQAAPHSPAELSFLPSYTVMLVAAALVCFRRAVLFVAMAYPQSKLIDSSRLDVAEERLRALGPCPRFLLAECERVMADLPTGSVWQNAAPLSYVHHAHPAHPQDGSGGAPSGGPNGHDINAFPFELDIMNWDLSILYPGIDSYTMPSI